MRHKTRKLTATLLAFAGLLTTGVASVPVGHAELTPQQKNGLEARRAELRAQLAVLLRAKGGANAALLLAENQYGSAQDAVKRVRDRLAGTNEHLASLQQQIATEEKRDREAREQLAIFTRAAYESEGDRSLLANLLSSTSFSEAMSRMHGANSVADQVGILQQQLHEDQAAVKRQTADLKKDAADAAALENELSGVSNRFLIAVNARNAELANASAPVRALEAQIADIDNQLAGPPPAEAPVQNGGTCGNHFAYGQCTWYVATRRCIPWMGNAKDWFYNAAQMGYLEGHEPAVGAVVVFWPGGDGASWVGHVGYVEVVGPAGGVPAGSFRLSEMNYGGWGRVNYRVLPNHSTGIQGFIYGHK